jgi:hypothetical protein
MYANYCGTSGGENMTLNVQNGPKKTSQTSLLDLCALPAGCWLLDAIFATASWQLACWQPSDEERGKSQVRIITNIKSVIVISSSIITSSTPVRNLLCSVFFFQ